MVLTAPSSLMSAPGAAEILRRSLRRYRGALAAGVIIVLGLAALAIYASIQSTRNMALALSEKTARAEETLARQQAEEQRRLAHELNERLNRQLHAGLIERGRAEGVASNGPGAESFLWPELLADTDSRHAFWALWELSARFPCLWTTSLQEQILAVDGSPDGELIAVGTRNGGVQVLHADSGRAVARVGVDPPAPAAGVTGLFFLDATTVLSVHADGYARTWSVGAEPSGGPVWRAHERAVTTAQLSRERHLLATADGAGEAALWALPEGRLLRRWKASESAISAIAFAPGSGEIATGTPDGVLTLWTPDPDEAPRLVGPHRGGIRSLTFSADGEAIYSLEQDRGRLRWDLRGNEPPQLIPGGVDSRRLAIDASGERLIVVHNIYVILEEPGPGTRRTLAYPIGSFQDAAWVGDRVVTVERTGEIRLWESRPWPAMRTFGAHTNWVFDVDFHPDGTKLVSGSGDASIVVWSYPQGERLATTPLPPRHRARTAVFSPDGSFVAAACSDRLVRLIDPETGAVITQFQPAAGEVYAVAINPDQTRLAAGTADGALTQFDLQTRTIAQQVTGLGSVPRGIAYSPDGRSLYTSGATEGIIIWNAETLERNGLLPTTTEPWSVAASPDGRTVAAGTFGATVEFFDLQSGARTIGAARHHLVAAGLAFSADGSMLASGGDDGTVKLWEPASARLLASLDTPSGPIPGVGFSPDGRALACATAGGAVEIWDLHHHDRHIAGNLEAAVSRYSGAEPPPENLRRLREWAAEVLQEPPPLTPDQSVSLIHPD